MRKYLLFVVVLGILAAACSSNDVVATVNGTPIEVDQVNRLRPPSEEPTPLEQFNGLLMAVIVQEIVTQAADSQLGVAADEATIEQEYQAVKQSIETAGNDYEQYLADNDITEEAVREIAYQRALRIAITDALVAEIPPMTDDELSIAYEAQLLSLAQVCARHILLETEQEADAALERLSGGEDFAALAVELSTGPSGEDGGDLGCAPPAGFVTEFADATMEAEPGVPFGPVQTEFGWHVILVEERTIPTLEETREVLDARNTQGPLLFQNFLLASIGAAEVEVEAEYGTWSSEDTSGDGSPDPTILPPGG